MTDPTVEALKEQVQRQDLRLDNHGGRIGALEQLDAARATEVGMLRESIDGVRSDLRKGMWALALFAITSLILQGIAGG